MARLIGIIRDNGALKARVAQQNIAPDFEARGETMEQRASRLVRYTLCGLAVFIAANSLLGLTVFKIRADTHESAWGLLIGLVAKIGMPILAGCELKVAARLGSKALRADAMEAISCGYLSAVLMVRLALIPLLIKECREAVTGKCGCEVEGKQ